MATPFLGEIRMFGGNFPPLGWSFCNGATLPISENSALFNLIGTTYGGDGVSTFSLPDLRSRFPMHLSSNARIGEAFGTETVTLQAAQMPVHAHPAVCGAGGGSVAGPSGAFWATDPQGNTAAYSDSAGSAMATGVLGNTGSGQPHENRQPYVGVSFIIALEGIFPSQS
jgi:microcystin-dependent protein